MRSIKHFSVINLATKFVGFYLLLMIFNPLLAVWGQSSTLCEEQLASAEEKYYTGYFEESIDLVKQCLKEGGMSSDTKIHACKLLSLNYLAIDNPAQAELCVEKLLEMVPDYSPNAENEPRQFVELVNAVRSEMYGAKNTQEQSAQPLQLQNESPEGNVKKSGNTSKWILIGAATGGVVAAIVTLAMRGGPDDGNGGRNGNPPPPR